MVAGGREPGWVGGAGAELVIVAVDRRLGAEKLGGDHRGGCRGSRAGMVGGVGALVTFVPLRCPGGPARPSEPACAGPRSSARESGSNSRACSRRPELVIVAVD